MRSEIKLLAVSIMVFGLIIGTSNIALSEMKANRVAVVDVNKIVSESAQVKVLKNEQVKKANELAKWLDVVKTDIAKQSTEAGKQKLAKKYESELIKKREANEKEYAKKLTAVDKSISTTIADQAKLKGYDIVLAKSMVLYGGDDITAEIAKVVK